MCCDPQGNQIYWQADIEPYVKNGGTSQVWLNKTSVFICPDYLVPAPETDEAGNPGPNGPNGTGNPAVGQYPLSSYSPNISITTAWWAQGASWAQGGDYYSVGTLASIARPASQIMLTENHGCCIESWGGGGDNNWTEARRHNGGIDYVIMDGHAKWYVGPKPQYGADANGEALGTPVATNLKNKPNAPIYFFPRAGE